MTAAIIRPVTASRFADLEALFRTSSITASCWDMWPRRTGVEGRERLKGLRERAASERNRDDLRALARRRRAPGLLAYVGGEPVGFVSLGPRADMRRLAASRATPPVDELDVWVVPCLYIHPKQRGKGVGVALLRAAVAYAAKHGAPAVEGYPRAGGERVHDDFAFYGTAEMFRRAGFKRVRGPLPDLPKGWTPRWTMRAGSGR